MPSLSQDAAALLGLSGLAQDFCRQCATMPACDMVKVRNAPMANSGIKRSVMPPKTISKKSGRHRQIKNADGIDQAAADDCERRRQEFVLRHHLAQPRKADEAGIGGKAEDRRARWRSRRSRRRRAHHRADQLRQHALIAGLRLIHGHDAIGHRQIGDAGEQNAERRDDDGSASAAHCAPAARGRR